MAVKAYEELYGVTPAVESYSCRSRMRPFLGKKSRASHDFVRPTLRGVHSPDEKMHIPAVEKFWNHLTLILKKLAGH